MRRYSAALVAGGQAGSLHAGFDPASVEATPRQDPASVEGRPG